jgi:putative tricarboxylic transport membrane protein
MGLFGISEILLNVEREVKQTLITTRVKGLLPSLKDWSLSIGSIVRGTGIGFGLGLLPGGGAFISSFASYAVEKRISKHPEMFGKGAIEGVAAPESANNAASTGAFVPLLTLGVPGNATMAMLLGALMIHGITPGPLLVKDHPGLFWGVISSMYVGNIMLLFLNLPLIGLWVRVLRVPYALLFPIILFVCLIGSYVINNSTVDVAFLLLFGVVGYLMRKFDYEPAPMVLAFVLSPLLENALRKSLIISGGSFMIFLNHPISLSCLIVAALLLITSFISSLKNKPQVKRTEEKD